MADLWTSLLPLIIASAVVPAQIVVTTLLLRSAAGRLAAVAWVAGMTSARLVQGLVFGVILGSASADAATTNESSIVVAVALMVIATVFYVSAGKRLVRGPDEDAPPPRWMATVERTTPARGFLLGFGLIAIGVKFWVFTLGAIAAIEEADLSTGTSILVYLVFVVLAASGNLLLIGMAYARPDRAGAMLDGIADFLQRHDRVIVIALGVIFGTWFMLKALAGLGIV